ncbi:MAG: phosphate acyltransferase PlsX [Kiloniellales bacterium]|nr:phosphate acyltransferase PlsX [Kiloniellales bacterium]
MSGKTTIALDAMGGDRAPQIVVAGANIARERLPNTEFLIFGRSGEVEPLLRKMPKLRPVTTLVHCDDVVDGASRPSVALRSGRSSSMRLAIDSVKDGRAVGVVSAGNTGALMAMSKFVLKTLPGVSRPAIASYFPSLGGEIVMLDLGANISCDADNLVDFAVMGSAFARSILGISDPTIGLLNVGSEEIKGHEYLHEASAILRTTELAHRFHGFVEGDDIAKGTVDVVVTDGFTGNVALKTAEGTARLFSDFLRQTFQSSLSAQLGYILAKSSLKKLKKRTDPRRYNGAMFLGLNGIAVKSHGGTDALGFANAIGVVADLYEQDIINKIKRDIAALDRNPKNKKVATG